MECVALLSVIIIAMARKFRAIPVWCNMLGSISYISEVLANFVLKFPNFRYRGIRGGGVGLM